MDEAGTFDTGVNRDMVEPGPLEEQDLALVRQLVREHEEKTASPRARRILVHWDQFAPLFRKVVPHGAGELVTAARDAYLQAGPAEPDLVLARRSA
jgi:glutamate synthase domain-containing protein 3